jgi:hypothetical protein
VGGTQLPVPFNSGWLFLNLNHLTPGDPTPLVSAEVDNGAQAWVFTIHDDGGWLATGTNALPYDNAAVPISPGGTFLIP